MNNVGSILVIIGAVLGLPALVGSIAVWFRVGYLRARAEDAETRVESLRGEIGDRVRREDDLEEQFEDFKRKSAEDLDKLTHQHAADLERLQSRIELLERENETIRSLVPSQDEMERVRTLQQETRALQLKHYDEATKFITEQRQNAPKTEAVIAQILHYLRRILATLGGDSG